MAVSWINFLGVALGFLVSVQVTCMNAVIVAINNWPGGLSRDIYISVWMTGILYACLLLLAAGWQLRIKKLIFIACILLLPFSFLQLMGKMEIARQRRIIVYNIPRTTAIDCIAGNGFTYAGDSISSEKQISFSQQVEPARLFFHVTPSASPVAPLRYNQLLGFQDIRLLVLNAPVRSLVPGKKVQVDILVISKNADLNMEEVLAVIVPGVIVFDPSNSLWKIAKWKRTCSALFLRFHSVPEEGAFIFTIRA